MTNATRVYNPHYGVSLQTSPKTEVVGYYYPYGDGDKRIQVYRYPLESRALYDLAVKKVKREYGQEPSTKAQTALFDLLRPPAPSPRVAAMMALWKCEHTNRRWIVELTPFEAHEFALQVDDRQMLDLLRAIDRHIPPMNFGMLNGAEDANNGYPFHTYEIGWDHGPVVYLKVITTYICDGSPLDLTALEAKLRRTSQLFKADEFDVEKASYTWTARFWWD